MLLEASDWIVIAAYVLVMLGVGLWAMARVKDCGGYLLGKRKMGRLMMMASQFGGSTSSNHPISIASACFKGGFSGAWLTLAFLFVTPWYWIYPAIGRRARLVTLVDFMRQRYGRGMEVIMNLLIVPATALSIGLGLKTAGVVLMVMSNGVLGDQLAPWAAKLGFHVAPEQAGEFACQLIILVLVLAYAIPGGIIAAYSTDMIQGFLILILSFVLVPFAISQAGGFGGLHRALGPEKFQLIGEGGFNGWWIFWFVTAMTISQSQMLAGSGAARNEMTARLAVFGSLLKRFCTIGWVLVGVLGIAIYAGRDVDPDRVFARMSADLLPVGLRGLMIASILAAVMSTVDSIMIRGSSVLVNNVYRAYFVKEASPKHYLAMARLLGAVLVLIGWFMATQVDSVVRFVQIVETFGSQIGIAIFAAIVWRRATCWGAIASLAVSGPLYYYGLTRGLPLEQYVPLYLIPAVATMIIVSLLTRQHNQREVDDFYTRLDTPLGGELDLEKAGVEADLLEKLDGELITVEDKDRDISQRLLLLDLHRLPRLIRNKQVRLGDYKVDLIGFAVLLAFAFAFVAGLKWLAGLGA